MTLVTRLKRLDRSSVPPVTSAAAVPRPRKTGWPRSKRLAGAAGSTRSRISPKPCSSTARPCRRPGRRPTRRGTRRKISCPGPRRTVAGSNGTRAASNGMWTGRARRLGPPLLPVRSRTRRSEQASGDGLETRSAYHAPWRGGVLPAGRLAPRQPPAAGGLVCGPLRISLVGVPVKAFAAVSTASASHFHMLHADCGQRLQYQKHCPQHDVVSAEAIVRGYEYARDRYVVVEPEELEQLRPARDKALVLEQFVPVAAVDPTFLAGRSLYLLPDGPAAQHPYGLLVETMHEAGKAALGRVVFTSQRQLVLVCPTAKPLVVDVLHYPAQVRGPAAWQEQVGTSTATEAERDPARQLLALASGPLDWSRYRDTSSRNRGESSGHRLRGRDRFQGHRNGCFSCPPRQTGGGSEVTTTAPLKASDGLTRQRESICQRCCPPGKTKVGNRSASLY
jgi:DNA end-binding protein Ku